MSWHIRSGTQRTREAQSKIVFSVWSSFIGAVRDQQVVGLIDYDLAPATARRYDTLFAFSDASKGWSGDDNAPNTQCGGCNDAQAKQVFIAKQVNAAAPNMPVSDTLSTSRVSTLACARAQRLHGADNDVRSPAHCAGVGWHGVGGDAL
jgi:hypothetical protein